MATFQNFIPSDDLSVVLSQHLLHALDDVALQSFLCRVLTVSLQAFCLDTLLAGRTILPAGLWTLVTTNVEILAREKRYGWKREDLQCSGACNGAYCKEPEGERYRNTDNEWKYSQTDLQFPPEGSNLCDHTKLNHPA